MRIEFLSAPKPALPIWMAIEISVLPGGVRVSLAIFGLHSAVLPKNIVFGELGEDKVCPLV